MPSAVTADRAHASLAAHGWSIGDMSYREPDGSIVWQVYCHCADQRIVARADTQGEAWAAALKQAAQIEGR